MSSLAGDPPSSHAPEAHGRPPLSDVTDGLGRIDGTGPEPLSAAALRDDLRWFAAQQRALEAMSARWLAELDRREPEGPLDLLTSPRRFLCDELPGLLPRRQRHRRQAAGAADVVRGAVLARVTAR